MFLANKLNKGAGVPTPVDAQFNYVTMLLHGDGTNGAQNNTFLDSSTNNFTITRNGNTTQGSFSPYGSNWSNFFDGTGDYLTVPYTTALQFPSNFTVECWVNLTSKVTNFPTIVNNYSTYTTNGGFAIFASHNSGTSGKYNVSFNGSFPVIESTTSISYGTWQHIALVRSGSTLTLYVDGVANGTSTQTATVTGTANNWWIGTAGDDLANGYLNGFVSNLRAVKGTAVYTSNFTPSTAPLTAISGTQLLTCQSNRFIDNSTNNFAITKFGNTSVQRFNPFGTSTAYSTSVIGGSGYFDGSGDYLTVANSSAFQLGTGNFTIECWYYAQDISLVAIFGLWGPSSSNTSWLMYTSGSGFPIWYTSTNGSTQTATLTSSIAITANAWNHIVIERVSGTTTIYVNGASGGNTATSVNLYAATSQLTIGYNPIGGTPDNVVGYLSDVRIVKGSSVYNGTFTPPTAPLTAITNTSLLTNMTNGAIFDNAMMNNLETVGNAQISTSVKKYGTGSISFDGTGDYLIGQVSPNLSFGTGDFTIEGWGYVTSTGSTFQCMLSIGAPVQIYARSGTIKIYFNDTDDTVTYLVNGAEGPASSVSPNTWFHFAVVRNGTTFSAYVNGVAGTPTTGITQQVALSANPISLGIYGGTVTLPFTGYLDDIRITKGYARYTANFTAPTAAFPNIGPV